MFIVKIKFLTMLSMVCMGLFSRFMLGFPLMLPLSGHVFQRISQSYHFPDGGNRTSLRLVSMSCSRSRRRCKLKNGQILEEDALMNLGQCDSSHFDFMGEVLEQENESFPSSVMAIR